MCMGAACAGGTTGGTYELDTECSGNMSAREPVPEGLDESSACIVNVQWMRKCGLQGIRVKVEILAWPLGRGYTCNPWWRDESLVRTTILMEEIRAHEFVIPEFPFRPCNERHFGQELWKWRGLDGKLLPQKSNVNKTATCGRFWAMFVTARSMFLAERSLNRKSSDLEARNSEQEFGVRSDLEEKLLPQKINAGKFATCPGFLQCFRQRDLCFWERDLKT